MENTKKVALVMPAFNEAEGISAFAEEAVASLLEWQVRVVIVDDASTDETGDLLDRLALANHRFVVIHNPHNLGHGPSSLRGWRAAMETDSDFILTSDGDGQISGIDLAKLVAKLEISEADIVEGARSNRSDPWFRELLTGFTRFLVWSRTGVRPRDANTPFRAYRSDAMRFLLDRLPESALVPNLMISELARKSKFTILEVDIASRPRRGADPSGTTWGQRFSLVPSLRLIRFCAQAIASLVRFWSR